MTIAAPLLSSANEMVGIGSRPLNKVTKKDAYPLPNMDSIQDKLRVAQVFIEKCPTLAHIAHASTPGRHSTTKSSSEPGRSHLEGGAAARRARFLTQRHLEVGRFKATSPKISAPMPALSRSLSLLS